MININSLRDFLAAAGARNQLLPITIVWFKHHHHRHQGSISTSFLHSGSQSPSPTSSESSPLSPSASLSTIQRKGVSSCDVNSSPEGTTRMVALESTTLKVSPMLLRCCCCNARHVCCFQCSRFEKTTEKRRRNTRTVVRFFCIGFTTRGNRLNRLAGTGFLAFEYRCLNTILTKLLLLPPRTLVSSNPTKSNFIVDHGSGFQGGCCCPLITRSVLARKGCGSSRDTVVDIPWIWLMLVFHFEFF